MTMSVSIEKAWLSALYDTLNAFTLIPENQWNLLLSKMHTLKLKKNEYFIKVGDVPDKLAFIIAGIFRVFYTTEAGVERILVIRDENWPLSAYSSFLENIKARFSIQALEDSCLLYISLRDYNELLLQHSCWQVISGKYAEILFLEKEKREIEFLTVDAETRYNNFLNELPKIEKRIPQYYIASYLGITPVALSRIRRKKLT
jgi:CRP-like cAMP-binding protein